MRERSVLEVFLAFLKLGLTSFGGPVAHIGYFRAELVARRHWLDDAAYTDLVALCQFLPGPASSQVGFALGLIRAGYAGALAAWAGFTLPSAALLTAFAVGATEMDGFIGTGVLHGLKLVAVSIVAGAVWAMARSLCPDRARQSIAVLSAVLILLSGSAVAPIASFAPIAAIVAGGVAGLKVCRAAAATATGSLGAPVSRRGGVASLALFAILLLGLPLLGAFSPVPGIPLFDAFYRAGALVFGGGHVVLPLLRAAVVAPGWVSDGTFLAGYGAAQAVPGPLFSFAAYLGAVIAPAAPTASAAQAATAAVAGAAVALVAIFLPGMLLLVGTLPFWDAFRSRPGAQAAMRGINAAVVGLLGAALYSPVWTSSVHNAADVGVALVGFVMLTAWRARPLLVVVFGAVAGIAIAAVT